MKHFCEQIIELHENKNNSTKPNKQKRSVILGEIEKQGGEKDPQKQHGANSNITETPDWIKAEKQEVRPLPGLMGIKVKVE